MPSDLCESVTVPPLNATERALATLWKQVLDVPHLPGLDDNFFALGGDSTAMVMLELLIANQFSVALPAGTLLSAPTLRELSRLVDTAAGSSCSSP